MTTTTPTLGTIKPKSQIGIAAARVLLLEIVQPNKLVQPNLFVEPSMVQGIPQSMLLQDKTLMDLLNINSITQVPLTHDLGFEQ